MPRLPRLSLGVVVILIPFVASYAFAVCSSIYDLYKTTKTFPQRHVEAHDSIERIYSHFVQYSAWPHASDEAAIDRIQLPPEWEYYDDPPLVILHGPYHMSLVYYFSTPMNGQIDRMWTHSIEGDKSDFASSAAYHAK